MIDGLSFDYACARLSAHLGRRPDASTWRRAHSARSAAAVVDVVRGSPAAGYVTGLPAHADSDDVDLALRQQLRRCIVEVAGWAPQRWRDALLWTVHLIDLPAIAHLLSDEAPPDWIRRDPALGRLALDSRHARREALQASAVASIACALQTGATTATRSGIKLPVALHAWVAQWHRHWPPCSGEQRSDLQRLERAVASHLAGFASTPLDDAAAARAALGEYARRRLRLSTAGPATLFAYLLLVALDLERLRGELAQRVAFVASGVAFVASGVAFVTSGVAFVTSEQTFEASSSEAPR